MSLGELAELFGWPLTKLRRCLATWAKAGHIKQASAGKGKVILAPVQSSQQAAAQLVTCAWTVGLSSTTSAEKAPRSIIALLTAVVLFVTAIGLTAVGLVMNARFAASFGQTAEAAVLLAAIGLAVDLLAVSLPSVGVQLWHRRSIATAGAAWIIWVGVLTLALLAATGFASTNIGDAVAGRAKIASESAALSERIERLRGERAGIAETRTVAAIEVELQKAQPEAQAVWKMTNGCRDVTRVVSGRACATVLELRQGQASAERRDAIDAELLEVQSKLTALPAIAAADPQALTAADIVTWVSGGAISPAPNDIVRLRALGLALMPSLAGIVAMLALALWQSRRA